jgi:hypothetical protein
MSADMADLKRQQTLVRDYIDDQLRDRLGAGQELGPRERIIVDALVEAIFAVPLPYVQPR